MVGSLLVAAALVLLVNATTPLPKKKRSAPKTPASTQMAELLAKAESLAQEQEYLQAHALVREARDLDSRRPESYLVGGRLYMQAGLPQGAEEEWKQGLDRAGEDPQILVLMALLELQSKRHPEAALGYLARAQAVSPDAPGLASTMAEATATLAEQRLQEGDRLRAKAGAQEALALDANCLTAHAVLARIAEREEKWGEAVVAWEKVFSAAPSAQARTSLATAHKGLGYQKLMAAKRDEAVIHFRRVIDLAADGVDLSALFDLLRPDSDAAFEEGKKAYESGDYARAKDRFAYASSLVPENYLADNHLGLALLKLGDRGGAVAAWESALAKAEKAGGRIEEAPTHKNLAILYKEMGRFEDAKRVGEAYLNKAPDGRFAKEIRVLIGQ